MKLSTKKIIIVSIIIIGIIGGFFGYKMANKSHLDIAATQPKITIEATKLIDEFTIDETTANTTYLDQLIAVNGVISSIKKEGEKGIISLKTEDDFGSVLCHLSKEASVNMSQFQVGQTIEIKGVCTGYLMDVILVRCEINNP